jgi:hypothetical protein
MVHLDFATKGTISVHRGPLPFSGVNHSKAHHQHLRLLYNPSPPTPSLVLSVLIPFPYYLNPSLTHTHCLSLPAPPQLTLLHRLPLNNARSLPPATLPLLSAALSAPTLPRLSPSPPIKLPLRPSSPTDPYFSQNVPTLALLASCSARSCRRSCALTMLARRTDSCSVATKSLMMESRRVALGASSSVTAFLRYVDNRRSGVVVCEECRRVVSLMGETNEIGVYRG